MLLKHILCKDFKRPLNINNKDCREIGLITMVLLDNTVVRITHLNETNYLCCKMYPFFRVRLNVLSQLHIRVSDKDSDVVRCQDGGNNATPGITVFEVRRYGT